MLTIEHNIQDYLALEQDDKLQTHLDARSARRFKVQEIDDPLIDIFDLEHTQYIQMDENITNTLVRQRLGEKLLHIGFELQCEGYQLVIAQMYRPYLEQEELFIDYLETLKDKGVLNEALHNHCINPYYYATHCTGGAVDVYLKDLITGERVDMGCELYAHDANAHINALNMNNETRKHRQILLNVFLEEECAPMAAQWWHFSYGDKYWAAFYKKFALYDII